MFETMGLGADFIFNAQGTENINSIANDLANLRQSMSNGMQTTQQYSESINRFSNMMYVAGGAIEGAGISATINNLNNVMSAASWQDQMIDATRYMSDVSVGAQNEYNKALAETARQFGKTKEEINGATISYMQMGKTTEDALRLVKNATYAATTWDMSAGEISEAFRSIKSSWQVNMEDQSIYEKYLNVINEVGNTTSATSADIVRFLDMSGGALATVGKVNLDNAISMVAAARYANINVGQFGTAMQTLMNRYAQKGADYFSILGLNIKDSTGSLIPFNEAIDMAAKKWDKYGEAQKQNFLSSFGMHHASTLGKYIGAYSEQEKAYKITQNKDQYDGSAEKEFNRVTDTFNFALSQMKTTLSDFKTTVWTTILPPLTSIIRNVNKVITKLSDFVRAHPAIAKTIALVSTLSGVALILIGGIMLLTATFGKLVGLMINGASPILMFKDALSGVGIVMRNFKGTLIGMLPSLKANILMLGKFSLAIGMLYAVWKYDFFNIRTMVSEFVSKVKISFGTVKELLSDDMSVSKVVDGVNKLQNSNSIVERFAGSFAKLGLVIKGVSEGWKDFTLSEDMYEKLKQTGLLPLVTQLLLFKMRMTHLFQGIKEGFIDTRNWINSFVKKAFGPALQFLHDKVLLPLFDIFPSLKDGMTGFLSILNGSNGEQANADYENVGKSLGTMLAFYLALGTAIKVATPLVKALGIAFKIFKPIFSIIGGIVKIIGKIGPAIAGLIGFFGDFGAAIALVAEGSATVAEAFALMGGPVGTIISTIASGLTSIGGMFSAIAGGITTVLGIIGSAVIAIAGAAGFVIALPAEVVGAIVVGVVALVTAIVVFRDQIWNGLKSFGNAIKNFFTTTVPNAFSSFVSFLTTIPGKIGYALGFVVGKIYLFFTVTIPNAIMTLIGTLANFFTVTIPNLFGQFVNFIGGVVDKIGNFFTVTLPNAFTTFLNVVKTIPGKVVNFFKSLPGRMKSVGKNIVNGIKNGISSAWNALKTAMKNFINGFVKGVKDALGIHSPSVVFKNIGVNVIQGMIKGITSLIGNLMSKAKTITNGIIGKFRDGISKARQVGSDIVNGIGNAIGNGVGFVKQKASDIKAGIVDKLGKLKSSAKTWGSNMISGFTSGIESAKSKVRSTASKVTEWVGRFIKFNSPSKEGEGRHIVEWGSNMISGFMDGIENKKGDLRTLMNSVITSPTLSTEVMPSVNDKGLKKLNSQLPLSTNINSTMENTLSSDGILGFISNQIASIINILSFGNSKGTIPSITNPSDVKLNTDYANTTQDKINSIYESVVNNTTNKHVSITIEKGAIMNEFKINDSSNSKELIALIESIIDDSFMPLLTKKMKELQIIQSE